MLNQICKLYVESQLDEAKLDYKEEEYQYYSGYQQALYNVLHANSYTFEQINNKIKELQKELNFNK